ncbi:hypothetical protein [Haloarcula rubripromontorii]|uniref:hypothetical protein n=1 Tax=Haloarcula rubripromontorii TaxID=1705562 RepID=UPI00345BF113
MYQNRRQVLQSLAGSAVLGAGIPQIAASGTAQETDDQKNNFTITPLSGQAAEQLQKELLSTDPLKAVQKKIESSGFKAEVEDHTVTAEITNEDTDDQWAALRLGFSYTGEVTDNQNHAAILYAHKIDDDSVSVRGIFQHEEDPVAVHEASGSASPAIAADDGGVTTYTVPVADGGE